MTDLTVSVNGFVSLETKCTQMFVVVSHFNIHGRAAALHDGQH